MRRVAPISLGFPAALLLAASAFAQQPPPDTSTPAPPPKEAGSPAPAEPTTPPASRRWLAPQGTLAVNLPTDQTLRRGMLQFLVTHRFRNSVEGSNAHSLYSIDSGADFGLGLSYSPVSHVQIEIYRAAVQDDYELAARVATRVEGATSGLFGAALRFGGDDRRDPLVVDSGGNILPDTRARTSYFAQGIFTLHLWRNRIELSAVPSYSSRTTSESRVFNVPVHAAVALSRSWNLLGEYQAPSRHVSGSIAQWTVAVEKVLYRHRFALVASNTTLTAVDETLSGDYGLAQKRQQTLFDNGYRNNNWHIGFNIIREFQLHR